MSFSHTTTLTIRGHQYRFVADENGIYINGTGGRATVYRIQQVDTNNEYALKVFKEEYQIAYRRDNFDYFQRTLPTIPAFAWVQHRMLLNEQDDGQLIQQYPVLRNAIVMPWFDLPQVDQVRVALNGKNSLIEQNKCKHFGQLLADTLAQLEKLGIAHGDIASSNVLLDWDQNELYIIDIEDMYHASLSQPMTTQMSIGGTGGYRFNNAFSSWQAEADRFAGAILISELLTLSNEECQEVSAEESYFHQDNLDMRDFEGVNDRRFATLYEELSQVSINARNHLKAAWLNTTDITKLPTLQQWSDAIGKSSQSNLFQRWVNQLTTSNPTEKNPTQPLPQPVKMNSSSEVYTPYARSGDSNYPIWFVYLLDLSRSMFKYEGQDGRLRFTIALDLINTINKELLTRSRKIGGFRPRYHISVIGYHKYCFDLLTPYHRRRDGENNGKNRANLHDGIHPIGSLEGCLFERSGINAITPIGYDLEIHADGETHMTQAFSYVHNLIQSNISKYKDSHPPYVFHITDGANKDKGDVNHEFQKLTNLSTNYGKTLVSTAYIGTPVIRPIIKDSWSGITDATIFLGDRSEHGDSLRTITSRMPATYHNKLSKLYPALSTDAYLFFPGTDEDMLKLALATSKATGE
jgi:serine/threonine protein kinase